MKYFLALLSILFFWSKPLLSQIQFDEGKTYIFEMKDGNTYIGKAKEIEKGKVYEIMTNVGVLTLRSENIKVMKEIKTAQMHDGEYWPESPHSSRYFFSPSGYGLRKGEGYYQNAWIVFNQVSYGFTDYFSLGIGTIPTFLFGETETLPIWLTPKLNFQYKNGKGAFGLGSIFFTVPGESGNGVGLVYGTNTFGTRDKQLSLGLGFGYDTDNGLSDIPVFNVAGLLRLSKNWALVTENYVFSFDGVTTIISGGARYMGKRLAIDFGGIIPAEGDEFYMAPWLSITVPFGKRY